MKVQVVSFLISLILIRCFKMQLRRKEGFSVGRAVITFYLEPKWNGMPKRKVDLAKALNPNNNVMTFFSQLRKLTTLHCS